MQHTFGGQTLVGYRIFLLFLCIVRDGKYCVICDILADTRRSEAKNRQGTGKRSGRSAARVQE